MEESELLELTDELNEEGVSALPKEDQPETVIESYNEEQEKLQEERRQEQVESDSVIQPTADEMSAGLISSHAETFEELVNSPQTVKPHDVAQYLAICTSVDVTGISEYV